MPHRAPAPYLVAGLAGVGALGACLLVLPWVVGDTYGELRTAALDHAATFGPIGSRYLLYGAPAAFVLAVVGAAHLFWTRDGVGPALGLVLLATAALHGVALLQIFEHAPTHAGLGAWSGAAGLAAIGVTNLLVEVPQSSSAHWS